MEIWLSFNNNEQRLRLPVLPSTFEVSVGNLNTRVNINELGNIGLLGKSDLKEMAIESFFPAQEYYFCEYTGFPTPYECIEIIEAWRLSSSPIRIIVTDTPINLAMGIENFTYGERDGTGDVYYSLELSEYKFPTIATESKSHGYAQDNTRPAKDIPQTYTPDVNDTPITIAKKTTGNSSNAQKIIDKNPVKHVIGKDGVTELLIW